MSVRQKTVREGDRIYNVWDQPDRGLVLDANRRVQNDRSARKMSWAEPHLRIPHLDLELLKQRFPELASTDGQIKKRAWVRFYNSAEARPYRVRIRSGGATNRSVGGI